MANIFIYLFHVRRGASGEKIINVIKLKNQQIIMSHSQPYQDYYTHTHKTTFCAKPSTCASSYLRLMDKNCTILSASNKNHPTYPVPLSLVASRTYRYMRLQYDDATFSWSSLAGRHQAPVHISKHWFCRSDNYFTTRTFMDGCICKETNTKKMPMIDRFEAQRYAS